MRTSVLARIGVCLLIALGSLSTATADDKSPLDGKWKLVLVEYDASPLIVFDVSGPPGALKGEVAAAQRVFSQPAISEIKVDGDQVRLEIASGGRKDVFTGTLPKAADQPVLGAFYFQENVFVARLEHAADAELGPIRQVRLPSQVMQIVRPDGDVHAKIEKLRGLLKESEGNPVLYTVYGELVRLAEKADLSAEDVRALVNQWQANAAPYGSVWVADARLKILTALGSQKKYAELKLELAQEAEKMLPADASTELRGSIARAVAESAEAAGKTEIAKAAHEQWQKLEEKLDDEYHEKVPPFKFDRFAGRKDAQANRVVVMELFTGAQCPPCVAADVAFDALLDTFAPTEFIGLQYHLHIPGPDPLTNPDSEARAKFYGVRGTPSTYFNGKDAAGGGGGMANSRDKYDEFVGLITGDLEGQRSGSIDLKLTRTGDAVQVNVKAQAKVDAAAAKGADGDKKAADDAAGEAKTRLRLVLVQEAVRYVGGNRLRFHHHVVRGMPGGAEGKELVNGEVASELTVDLAQVRSGLDQYLTNYASTGRAFPVALPPLDLKKLSIVALVQDDATKRILTATLVPVPDAP